MRPLYDDPAYAFIFGDTARRALMRDFFIRHLRTHVPHRCSFVRLAEDGALQATVTLRPPGGIQVQRATLLRGLFAMALTHGPGVIRRMLFVKSYYEGLEAYTASGPRYWHVHMMAVDPELQGKGIGGALLDDVLRTARGPEPIVLTTHKPINVPFYARARFRVTSEQTVRPLRGEPYTVWCMRREPR